VAQYSFRLSIVDGSVSVKLSVFMIVSIQTFSTLIIISMSELIWSQVYLKIDFVFYELSHRTRKIIGHYCINLYINVIY